MTGPAVRWGWVLAAVEAAQWHLGRMRGGWGDDVDVEIRAAATMVSDGLETIARYVRQRSDGAPARRVRP